MANRNHILLYRNGSGTAQPPSASVYHGEVAVTYTANHEKLYTKNSTNNIVEFSSDHIINDRMDEQDTKMSDAIGLSTQISSEDGKKVYQYTPSNTMLNECHTVNDSVETLAAQLKGCLQLIQELKANVYMIDTEFIVSGDTETMTQHLTFQTSYNGNTTTPASVIFKKSINDGEETIILNTENQATGGTTSAIEGAKERYSIIVTPNLEGAIDTRIEETRYLCYVGCKGISGTSENASGTSENASGTSENASGTSENASGTSYGISGETLAGFQKILSNGQKVECEVTTSYGDYIWVCVPKTLNIVLVTSEDLPVSLSSTVIDVETDFGIYSCYHSAQKLDAHTWDLVIKHVK